MASNYTRLQNIFLELLNHDVDFKVEKELFKKAYENQSVGEVIEVEDND